MTEIEEVPPAEDAEDGYITAVTLSEPGTHTVLYSATDGQLKSSATATIKVAENAPLRAPIARDDFVDVEEVMDPETEHVDVDVLANDSDPDGSTNDLTVELDGSYEGVELIDDQGTVRIVPQEEQQRIRYTITDVDDLLRRLHLGARRRSRHRSRGAALEVQAGPRARSTRRPGQRAGGPVQAAQITDPGLVTALHGDGSELVQDETTLIYRPP